jgi:asparagine N-glycosylation enzyme membrane subunit Stt3
LTIGLLFWILMILWFVFGIVVYWPGQPARPYAGIGNVVLLFVLFFLLGWAEFGFVVQGPDGPRYHARQTEVNR